MFFSADTRENLIQLEAKWEHCLAAQLAHVLFHRGFCLLCVEPSTVRKSQGLHSYHPGVYQPFQQPPIHLRYFFVCPCRHRLHDHELFVSETTYEQHTLTWSNWESSNHGRQHLCDCIIPLRGNCARLHLEASTSHPPRFQTPPHPEPLHCFDPE